MKKKPFDFEIREQETFEKNKPMRDKFFISKKLFFFLSFFLHKRRELGKLNWYSRHYVQHRLYPANENSINKFVSGKFRSFKKHHFCLSIFFVRERPKTTRRCTANTNAMIGFVLEFELLFCRRYLIFCWHEVRRGSYIKLKTILSKTYSREPSYLLWREKINRELR